MLDNTTDWTEYPWRGFCPSPQVLGCSYSHFTVTTHFTKNTRGELPYPSPSNSSRATGDSIYAP